MPHWNAFLQQYLESKRDKDRTPPQEQEDSTNGKETKPLQAQSV